MKLLLAKNAGYQWFIRGKSAFKGYIIDEKAGTILRGYDALDAVEKNSNYEELRFFLTHIDGSFSFVVDKGDLTWACVDVARSMPLFYTKTCDIISDSVKDICAVKGLTTDDLEISAVEEYIRDGYIGHNRTFYKSIQQLDAGQMIEFTGNLFKREYYYIHKADIIHYKREQALNELSHISEKVFDDVLRIVGNRPIVISLSGGYDSRYVACMLKERGASDVSCYTYGRGETFEVLKSRQVAEKLGYRWTFVDYNDETMKKYFTGEYLDFFDVYGGRDGIPYIQNYVAVKVLDEKKWFKPGSVFVTGLCNDMQSGAYTKLQSELKDFEPTIDFLVRHIIRRRNFNKSLGKKALKAYEGILRHVINDMHVNRINNYQEFVQNTEAIEAILMHSRLFLHMNDIHAALGYEWILPCWNKNSLNFWYSLPVGLRADQNLYEEWQLTSLPLKYGLAEKKKKVSYTLYSGFERTKARLRLLAKRLFFYPLGISINEETNFNNFNLISARYFKRINEKNILKFRNLSIINILALYTAERWLGKDIYTKYVKDYEES